MHPAQCFIFIFWSLSLWYGCYGDDLIYLTAGINNSSYVKVLSLVSYLCLTWKGQAARFSSSLKHMWILGYAVVHNWSWHGTRAIITFIFVWTTIYTWGRIFLVIPAGQIMPKWWLISVRLWLMLLFQWLWIGTEMASLLQDILYLRSVNDGIFPFLSRCRVGCYFKSINPLSA